MTSGAHIAALALTLWAIASPGLVCAAEKSPHWQLLMAMDFAGGGAMDIFLDTSSVQRQGGATAVEKFVLTNPSNSPDSPPASERTDRIAIDCATKRWAIVDQEQLPRRLEWQARGKDLRRDTVVNAVCANHGFR